MNNFFLVMILSVLVASISQVLLKKSSLIKYPSFLKEYMNVYVIVGYILLLCSTLLTIFALTGMDYKNVPIIESSAYILIMIMSKIFLNEKLTRKKIIGNIVILLGIIIFYI